MALDARAGGGQGGWGEHEDRVGGWVKGSWQPRYFRWGRMTPRETCLDSLCLVPASHQTPCHSGFPSRKR